MSKLKKYSKPLKIPTDAGVVNLVAIYKLRVTGEFISRPPKQTIKDLKKGSQFSNVALLTPQ